MILFWDYKRLFANISTINMLYMNIIHFTYDSISSWFWLFLREKLTSWVKCLRFGLWRVRAVGCVVIQAVAMVFVSVSACGGCIFFAPLFLSAMRKIFSLIFRDLQIKTSTRAAAVLVDGSSSACGSLSFVAAVGGGFCPFLPASRVLCLIFR